MIADAADSETTLGALSTVRAATDRLEPEDPGEWGPDVDADSKRYWLRSALPVSKKLNRQPDRFCEVTGTTLFSPYIK